MAETAPPTHTHTQKKLTEIHPADYLVRIWVVKVTERARYST